MSKSFTERQGRSRGTTLPPDLQQQARERLTSVGFVLSLLFLIGLGITALLSPGALNDWRVVYPLIARSIVSLLVGLIAWKAHFSTPVVLRIGLVYEVVLCLMTSIASTRLALDSEDLGQLTWTAILIIIFPLLIPSTFRMVLIVSILSAATRPLALGMTHLVGLADPRAWDYVETLPHVTIAVFIAAAGARIIYGMTSAITSARELGSYSLETMLGKGGMGEVWRAKHAMLARPAALKLIRPEIFEQVGPDNAQLVLRRFEREAQVTARLQSPHTIELYDFGITDDGTFFYAMELLDGLNLGELVRAYGPVPPDRTIWFLEQVCHSLKEAHQIGLVHRDIKPPNIMVCRYGSDYDFVKVLDFGIVKDDLQAAHASEELLTRAGAVAGTPGYMAPEALKGEPVDHFSDIYSLGCVAYLLLTGEKLFTGMTSQAAVAAHIYETPEPLSDVTRDKIPLALERLVMDCLEKEREKRPQSIEEIATRLREIKLKQHWSQTRARQWWETHRPGSVIEDRRPTSAPATAKVLEDSADESATTATAVQKPKT